MSRIRSIHPGLHTDERFVSVTMAARLLFIGIWNECDDQGIFEWAPLKLKMRILPADNVDAAQLLEELASQSMVLRFDVAGRAYGAVRNFSKWQRPKKPNAVHPAPEHALAFAKAGLAPVPHQFGTAGENRPQMEDEGGRRSSDAGASGADAPANPPKPIDLKAAVFGSGVPMLVGNGMADRNARSMLGRWRQQYGDGAVLDALSAAQAESPSDVVAWISKSLETRRGPKPARPAGRPSAWAPRPGMAGAEPVALED